MKLLILSLSLIIGLATSVSADRHPFKIGDVYFCEMDHFKKWDETKEIFKYQEPQKFKFTIVDEKTIKFGDASKNYFAKVEMLITSTVGEDWDLTAYSASKRSSIHVKYGKFNFVSSNAETPIVIMATCDRF